MGSLGIVLLIVAYFVLMAILARLQDPEKWFRVTNLGIMLLNWNAIWKFLFFLHASFALTGTAILFFFFRWSKTSVASEGETEYTRLVRNYGAGMAFAFSLSLPVFYLFYIFTTADVALGNTVYVLAVSIVFFVLVNALLLFQNLKTTKTRFGAATFVIFLIVFVLVSTVDQKTMSNASAEHRTLLVQEANRIKIEREAALEALAAQSHGVDRGKEIFEGQCSACHRFDSRLVGPPLREVLPKYREDIAALRAFVKSPSKKNEGYPPMPALGLSDTDIEAVTDYVLQRLEEGSGQDDSDKGE
jgi:mono/diheme cytochrome c family protein